jgi:hypothetical protein
MSGYVGREISGLVSSAPAWCLGSNPDISKKYEMGDIACYVTHFIVLQSRDLHTTPPQKIYQKIIFVYTTWRIGLVSF